MWVHRVRHFQGYFPPLTQTEQITLQYTTPEATEYRELCRQRSACLIILHNFLVGQAPRPTAALCGCIWNPLPPSVSYGLDHCTHILAEFLGCTRVCVCAPGCLRFDQPISQRPLISQILCTYTSLVHGYADVSGSFGESGCFWSVSIWFSTLWICLMIM